MNIRQIIYDDSPDVTQFNPLDCSITEMTHRATTFLATAISFCMFILLGNTLLSILISSVVAMLGIMIIEQLAHQGRHGLTLSEYKMMGIGVLLALPVELFKVIA